jgi:hypothetical protein
VADLLSDPPDWLAKQLVRCRANPDKLLRPTTAAMSHVLYGTTEERAGEIAPVLDAYLKPAEEVDYEEL